MRIAFCGVRGSTPAPGIDFVRYGGHTSCLALAHDGAPAPSLILDAGAGLMSVTSLLGGPGEDGFGEYHPAAIELARDADALVHDAQLFPEELAAEADFGHSVADYPVELARRAGTRSVVLFHHHHHRTDDALDGLAQRLGGGSAPEVSVATEGVVLEL